MNRIQIKDTIYEIRNTFGRFFSIFMIVAIGVAFYAGITASAPTMKYSADHYFDQYDLADIRLTSTLGVTKSDITEIKNVKGVKGVYGVKYIDALAYEKSVQRVIRVIGYPAEKSKKDADYINQIRLVKGRMPEKDNECLIEYGKIKSTSFKIGDTITFHSGSSDKNISDELTSTSYKIVGYANYPYYLSYEKGASKIGSGTVNNYVIIKDTNFKMDYYTDAYVTVKNAKRYNSYTDDYFKIIKPVKNRLKKLVRELADKRYESIKLAAMTSIRNNDTVYAIQKRAYDLQLAQYDAGKGYLDDQTRQSTENQLKAAGEELEKLRQELEKAKKSIESLSKPKWYVLDRNSHYSFVDYGSAADRMSNIAKVFPVFFFIVAALVCLTTMTRMVDEQREIIGTMKALGYNKLSIASKYILYALLASISGGIFGAAVGMIIFPTVVYNAWAIMYAMPSVRIQPDIQLAATAIGVVTGITLIATISSCISSLRSTPAELMRPKPPANGKTILLEKVGFIWKHLSFTMKVTFRNIFRYKKRFLMTILGIGGCTALLVSGYGISDSINHIVDIQYGQIYKYDALVELESDADANNANSVLKKVNETNNVKKATLVSKKTGLYTDTGEDKSVTLFVAEDTKNIAEFVGFRNRQSGKKLFLKDNGAIISEKLARDKKIKVGDYFSVDNGDGKKKNIKITGIMENYVGHFLYMSKSYYQSVYGSRPEDTTILVTLKNTGNKQETSLGNKLLKLDGIDSVTFYTGVAANFSKTIGSLDTITLVLTISAGMLAFVVLYNLSNINITERIREIATIKVLGFYDNEVSAYVYRENLILTLIGSLFGLLLGIWLHGMIMDLAELDTVMFGRNIEPMSFVISVLITLGFAIIVNIVMYFKLQKVKMVESLKSVE